MMQPLLYTVRMQNEIQWNHLHVTVNCVKDHNLVSSNFPFILGGAIWHLQVYFSSYSVCVVNLLLKMNL